MRTLHVAFLAVTFASAGLVVIEACGQYPSDSCETQGTCPLEDSGSLSEAGSLDGTMGSPDVVDGGSDAMDSALSSPDVVDGGPDATDSAPPCDTTQTPAESSCVISDTLAIFVSPTG